jgi:iron complex outermembrane receptor protein
MKISIFQAFWLLCALACIERGWADAPQPSAATGPAALKKMTLEELSQVEVTSPTKEPTPAFNSPTAIYIITGEDIRRSGATTIPEALRLAPGVEVAQIDANKWSVGIRGFGTRLSRSVLVLIDGRTVYTPLFAGTYWEVQDTLLQDIDRIEVIRGPGGTIWGPNAVNGVINIITKRTQDTQGTYAEVGGGNVEQGFANFRYGGSNGNGLSYRVYAKGFTRGPEYHFDHDNFDDWRGAQGGFRMDWGTAGRSEYMLEGDLYRQSDGERVAVSTYVPAFSGTADGNADLSGGDLTFAWRRRFSERNDLQLEAYYDRTNRYEPNLGENRDTFDLDLLERTKVGKRQEFLYGLEARSSQGHFLEAVSGLVFSPANRNDYLISGFVEDDITLVNQKLLLTLGSKFLSTNYTGFETEPSARLMWTPGKRHAFWAAFTRAVRTPSDAEEDFYLTSYLGMSGGYELFARFNANPKFAPEQLNGYETGYRVLIGKSIYLDFAGFYNHYHDLFSQDLAGPPGIETTLPFPESQQPPPHVLIAAQFRNDLFGRTNGGEVAPEWRPTKWWRLRGSYSYLDMVLNKAPGAALGGTPAAVEGASPRNEVNVESSFDVRKLQIDLMYRYVSALPAVSAPSYSTGDARIAWKFSPQLEFSLVGRDLFQPYHIEYAADPGGPVAIRRSGYASLTWTSR